jgi:hypothetical protein
LLPPFEAASTRFWVGRPDGISVCLCDKAIDGDLQADVRRVFALKFQADEIHNCVVIADGGASGDSISLRCRCRSVHLVRMMRFFPSAIDRRLADKRSPTLSQMIDFVIAGLSTPADQPVS